MLQQWATGMELSLPAFTKIKCDASAARLLIKVNYKEVLNLSQRFCVVFLRRTLQAVRSGARVLRVAECHCAADLALVCRGERILGHGAA